MRAARPQIARKDTVCPPFTRSPSQTPSTNHPIHSYTLFSPPTARVPQLSLRHLLHALSHLQPPSSLDPAPTLSTAESLVFSLLSRRLILGNVQRTADDSVLVLRRAGAFPPPETVLLDAEDDPFREGAGGAGRKVGGGGGGGGGVQSMAGQTVRLSGVKAIGA